MCSCLRGISGWLVVTLSLWSQLSRPCELSESISDMASRLLAFTVIFTCTHRLTLGSMSIKHAATCSSRSAPCSSRTPVFSSRTPMLLSALPTCGGATAKPPVAQAVPETLHPRGATHERIRSLVCTYTRVRRPRPRTAAARSRLATCLVTKECKGESTLRRNEPACTDTDLLRRVNIGFVRSMSAGTRPREHCADSFFHAVASPFNSFVATPGTLPPPRPSPPPLHDLTSLSVPMQVHVMKLRGDRNVPACQCTLVADLSNWNWGPLNWQQFTLPICAPPAPIPTLHAHVQTLLHSFLLLFFVLSRGAASALCFRTPVCSCVGAWPDTLFENVTQTCNVMNLLATHLCALANPGEPMPTESKRGAKLLAAAWRRHCLSVLRIVVHRCTAWC